MLDNTEGVIKRDNPEKLATLGTQLSFVLLPLRYSLTCICPVSCIPYVASFSELSFFITLDCPFLLPLRCSLEKLAT
jgi:hypothetical protein